MKHSIKLFLTTVLCITPIVSIAMELEQPQQKELPIKTANILTEVTCLQKALVQALYLTDDKILILNQTQANIVDLITNTIIKRICNDTFISRNIAIHPDRTKFALTSYILPPYRDDNGQHKITIYNAQTYEPEHIINEKSFNCGNSIESLHFNPLDDNLLIRFHSKNQITNYNYKTEKSTLINTPELIEPHLIESAPRVSFHRTQPHVCLSRKSLYIHNLATNTKQEITKSKDFYKFSEYTPNGTVIILGTNTGIKIIKLDQEQYSISNQTIQILKKPKKFFDYVSDYTIAIHPNNKTLLTLSTIHNSASKNDYFFNYWDINTLENISTRHLLLEKSYLQQAFFSPSGTKLLILTNNVCLEVKVPVKAIYEKCTKKAFPYLLFIIKNYAHDVVAIPQELIQLLATTLLETYKR